MFYGYSSRRWMSAVGSLCYHEQCPTEQTRIKLSCSVGGDGHQVQAVCSLLQALLLLATVACLLAPYHSYEAGGGRREVYPPVNYVTSRSTGYEEPVGNLYSDPSSYYGAGGQSGGGRGGLAGRVKIQVRECRLLWDSKEKWGEADKRNTALVSHRRSFLACLFKI